MRANSAPQFRLDLAYMVAAASALEKLFKIRKIFVFSAIEIIHKTSMQIYKHLIQKPKNSIQWLYFDYIIWYNKTKLQALKNFFKEVHYAP